GDGPQLLGGLPGGAQPTTAQVPAPRVDDHAGLTTVPGDESGNDFDGMQERHLRDDAHEMDEAVALQDRPDAVAALEPLDTGVGRGPQTRGGGLEVADP